MDANTPRIRSLLRQAKRNESAGKRVAAEELYRKVIAESPDTVDAWLGLARVLKDPTEEESAFLKVLSLDPENGEASEGLAYLRGEKKPENTIQEEENQAIKENSNSSPVESIISIDENEERVEQDTGETSYAADVLFDQQDVQRNEKELTDDHSHQVEASREVLYCANHPSRETNLRCNRCGKPICSSCARPTPVGYRCPECIREHEDVFFTATAADYLVAALVAFPLGLIAGFLAWRITSSFIGLLVIFLAPIVGNFIGRIVFRAAGRRRGRWLPHLVSSAIVVGGLLFLLANLLFGNLFGIIFMGIYVVAASGAAYYQMR